MLLKLILILIFTIEHAQCWRVKPSWELAVAALTKPKYSLDSYISFNYLPKSSLNFLLCILNIVGKEGETGKEALVNLMKRPTMSR